MSRYTQLAKHTTTLDSARARFVGAKPPHVPWGERNAARPVLEPDPKELTRRRTGAKPSAAVVRRRDATRVRLEAWLAPRGEAEFSIAEAAVACGDPACKRCVREEDIRWIVRGGGYARVGYAGWCRK